MFFIVGILPSLPFHCTVTSHVSPAVEFFLIEAYASNMSSFMGRPST